MNRYRHATVHAQATVPAVALRVAIVALGASAFVLVPFPMAWVAFALAVLGAIVPISVCTWASAAIIALAQLVGLPPALDLRPFAVLAIVHLLHVLGALTLVVDWRGTLQVRAVVPTVRRLLAIQIPAAAVLVVVLAFGPWHLPTGVAAIVALCAGCAAAAAVLLVVVPRRERAGRA
ncbi:hypothetical protein ASD65_00905 [Microbacterium sp. Root61]|uniref:hypothetical protein n=1 Tax=Microbacterium sp. Root61 TaxID=1736570 RepID=UPI0006F7DC56|nr:hypothetical protein [Microbacterium sp. Root61]KRA23135.1 hypothetical protein ASD65_00905 [Microbacterium sp. Root61]